jgi:hypothetical protein
MSASMLPASHHHPLGSSSARSSIGIRRGKIDGADQDGRYDCGRGAARTNAYAQSGEVTLYSKGHFAGARQTVAGSTQRMQIPFTVKSVEISQGTDWELCTGNHFSGCHRFSKSDPAMAMSVRSARPVGAAAEAAAAAAVANAPPGGRSLRGMASEYFVAPEASGNRIAVRPGTAAAMSRRADQYCRSIGWRSSAHAALQAAGGTAYLADVLCI